MDARPVIVPLEALLPGGLFLLIFNAQTPAYPPGSPRS